MNIQDTLEITIPTCQCKHLMNNIIDVQIEYNTYIQQYILYVTFECPYCNSRFKTAIQQIKYVIPFE